MTPPILCYHKVDTRFEVGVTRLGPRLFARQMLALREAGYRTLSSRSLQRRLAGDARQSDGFVRPSTRSVMLTFDDGYAGLGQYAFPVIEQWEYRALVFVITDFVGDVNRWDVRYGGPSFRHMNWDALGYWQERGIEVHSHTASHPRLTWASDGQVADELGRSREVIAQRLGREPSAICYPFGAVDARVERLAREAGYSLGFAGPRGAGSAMTLRRDPVYAWDTFGLPLVLRGGAVGAAAGAVARIANRFSIATSVITRLRR